MDRDLHQRRASSFGRVAASYADYRPGYPDDAVTWALQPAACRLVLDLGAGTGKLTEALVRADAEVIAVEPDAAMLAELRSHVPGAQALEGTAESIPVGDGSVDAVLVGQAFHWFDPERAMPEIARVLRSGGVLALIGNAEDDSVAWVAGFLDTIRSVRGPELDSVGRGYADLPDHPAFTERESRSFRWTWSRTVDSVVDTVATHSWVLLTPPVERAAALAAIRSHLAQQHPAGDVVLPMVTRVVRVVRAQRMLRS